MKTQMISINVDVGEGLGNEAKLMPLISSCNIACGGHAGDEDIMRNVVKLAKTHHVKIGAHPSFPDKANFGRKKMNISHADLYTSIKKQIRTLLYVLREERVVLNHVKPHGMLYNLAATNYNIAMVIIEIMKSIAMPLKLYVPYGSIVADLAEQEGLPIAYEAFADRNYNDDLTLVSRTKTNAIISNKEDMFEHVSRILWRGKVKSIHGKELAIKADTFCVHGDNPNLIKLISALHKKFNDIN